VGPAGRRCRPLRKILASRVESGVRGAYLTRGSAQTNETEAGFVAQAAKPCLMSRIIGNNSGVFRNALAAG
jgi:hypothetical protein